MQDLKKKLNVKREYSRLNEMIRQTSEVLEALVQNQPSAMVLPYSRKTMYLCLVKRYDQKSVCYGVRWTKYRINPETGRKAWYKGWSPGKVPPATQNLLSPEDKQRFKEIDSFAFEVSDLRHTLTSKKKRIIATFQNINQTDKPCMQEILEEIKALESCQPESATEFF